MSEPEEPAEEYDDAKAALLDADSPGATRVAVARLAAAARDESFSSQHETIDLITAHTDHDQDTAQRLVNGSSQTTLSWDDVHLSFDSNEKGSTILACNNAAELITARDSFLCERNTRRLYWYDPDLGYFVRNGATRVEERLHEHLPYSLNGNRIRDVTKLVRVASYVDADQMGAPEGFVCVGNGVLDLTGEEVVLREHDPAYRFLSGLPVEYDPAAESALWERCLADWAPEDDVRRTLQEWAGYCLESWHHWHETNLYLVGPRRSGKSTFTETVQELFGASVPTAVSLSPQQIADKRFDRAFLVDAMINARSDVNASKIEDSGTLKTVLSGEQTQFEDKGQDPFFTRATAKHLFNGNWTPRVVNEDEALFRRFILLPFTQRLDADDAETSLKRDLKAPEHLSAILNWAIEGQQRLDANDAFTIEQTAEETREIWRSWRGPTRRFLAERCEITGNPDDYIPKREAYDHYKEWATANGYEIVAQQSLTKRWKLVPHIEDDNSFETPGGEKLPAFTGVRLAGSPPPADNSEDRQSFLPGG